LILPVLMPLVLDIFEIFDAEEGAENLQADRKAGKNS